jgi:hypothetical protein
MRVAIELSPGARSHHALAMSRNAPICVDSAAFASGEWIGASSAAERVCRKAKAQGYGLREGHRRDATARLRVGGMALASHYGINL